MKDKIQVACDVLKKLLLEKNEKYGNSFFKTANEYGNIVLALRIEDKLNRFKHLMLDKYGDSDENESIKDTLVDLAGYALLASIYLENMETNKL